MDQELQMTPQTATEPAKMSPQAARGIAEYLLADLQHEIGTTVRVIEAAQGCKLEYKPDEKSTTGIGLIRHIVTSDAWFLNCVANGKMDGGEYDQAGAEKLATPSEAAAKYKETVGAAMNRVRALPDEKLAEDLDFFGMMKLPRVAVVGIMIKHSIHHRGQLSTYLRSMGGKVPSIYGPSADSK
jgi:uncharacterized damage-inducible protein DinB